MILEITKISGLVLAAFFALISCADETHFKRNRSITTSDNAQSDTEVDGEIPQQENDPGVTQETTPTEGPNTTTTAAAELGTIFFVRHLTFADEQNSQNGLVSWLGTTTPVTPGPIVGMFAATLTITQTQGN